MKRQFPLGLLSCSLWILACNPVQTEVITLYDPTDVSPPAPVDSDEDNNGPAVANAPRPRVQVTVEDEASPLPERNEQDEERISRDQEQERPEEEQEESEAVQDERSTPESSDGEEESQPDREESQTEQQEETEEETEEEQEEEVSPPEPEVQLHLQTGYMSPAGIFAETGDTLHTCEESVGSNPQFLIQIGASLSGDDHLDPWFTRFEFSSDTSEWVGLYGNTVYQTLEDCQNAGTSCDEVEVGEGNSGYPDQGAGHMGIQNVYCRYWNSQEYAITVSVRAITLNPPLGGSPVLAEGEIQIMCKPQTCCPNANYLDIYGNHTTEPWECDD